MDNNEEYLTVSEFANRVGLTRQAVYHALNNRLTGFWITEDGKKLISSAALDLFRKTNARGNSSGEDEQERASEQPLDGVKPRGKSDRDSSVKPLTMIAVLQSQVEAQKRQIFWLQEELKDREAAIKEKDAVITEKDKRLNDYMDRLLTLAEQAQELAGRAQMLHAAKTLPVFMNGEGTDMGQASASAPAAVEPPEPNRTEPAPAPQEEDAQKKKRSFWQWLTGAQ